MTNNVFGIEEKVWRVIRSGINSLDSKGLILACSILIIRMTFCLICDSKGLYLIVKLRFWVCLAQSFVCWSFILRLWHNCESLYRIWAILRWLNLGKSGLILQVLIGHIFFVWYPLLFSVNWELLRVCSLDLLINGHGHSHIILLTESLGRIVMTNNDVLGSVVQLRRWRHLNNWLCL